MNMVWIHDIFSTMRLQSKLKSFLMLANYTSYTANAINMDGLVTNLYHSILQNNTQDVMRTLNITKVDF